MHEFKCRPVFNPEVNQDRFLTKFHTVTVFATPPRLSSQNNETFPTVFSPNSTPNSPKSSTSRNKAKLFGWPPINLNRFLLEFFRKLCHENMDVFFTGAMTPIFKGSFPRMNECGALTVTRGLITT